jgi:hypothetical protein
MSDILEIENDESGSKENMKCLFVERGMYSSISEIFIMIIHKMTFEKLYISSNRIVLLLKFIHA